MMDQDKISSLYTDLRRESLSTGSYPITVRHLESMIRMAEASAKMHLREYVRSDDIDLAIQVMVGSFVSAQKSSIKKHLERGFRCVRSSRDRVKYHSVLTIYGSDTQEVPTRRYESCVMRGEKGKLIDRSRKR